jgi:DeoR/GlpR family transcriptional regulator of sugar metabolism
MKPDQRQRQILDLLRILQNELKVEELAERFDVSPLTIRRDLDVLAEDKTIIRTHGGCIAVGRAALETEYHKKVAKNFELKQAIAQSALELIEDHAVILLNDGSTTFHVGMKLGNRGGCTMYTNSLAMVSEYSRFRDVRLFLLAGEYDEDLYSIHGSLTEYVLESLHFDRIFLGTDAIDADGRCLVRTPEEARLSQVMLRTGGSAVLVADHTKVGAAGHVAYGNLRDFDVWITTDQLSPDDRTRYQAFTQLIAAPQTNNSTL